MDVIALILEVLGDGLNVPVTTELPADRDAPVEMVTVEAQEQTDGFINAVRCYLTCWGLSDRNAHSIAVASMDVLMDAALDHPWLSSARLDSMGRDRWARTGQARYEVVMDLTINSDE